jgi:hypothetical protein
MWIEAVILANLYKKCRGPEWNESHHQTRSSGAGYLDNRNWTVTSAEIGALPPARSKACIRTPQRLVSYTRSGVRSFNLGSTLPQNPGCSPNFLPTLATSDCPSAISMAAGAAACVAVCAGFARTHAPRYRSQAITICRHCCAFPSAASCEVLYT